MTNHSLSTLTTNTLPACLTDALEQIDTGVMAIDPTHRITYVNAAICAAVALTRDALIGQELWTAFPELAGTVFEQQYTAAVATLAPVEFDAPYARLGIWLHVRAVPSADGLAIYLTDISHEKRSAATLRAFLDASPDAAILLDRAGIVIEVNQHALDRMDTTREAFVGTDGYATLPPTLAATRRAQNDAVLQSGQPVCFEDGREGAVYANTVVPVRDEQGTVTRLAIFSRDVTERKAVEATLHRTLELLTLAEHGGRLGSFETDFAAKTAWLSPAFQALYGMAPGTWDGRHESWITSIHPEDLPRIDACYARTFAAQAPQFDIDFRIRRPDGEERWLSGRCCVSYDADGAPTRLVGVNIDITDRHRTEQTLRDRTAFLELMIESIPQYLFWKDTASVYQGCNALFAHAAGLSSSAEIIGITDHDLGWKREKADDFRMRDQHVMTSGLAERHVEETRLLADGSAMVLDVNKVPIRDADGEIVGVLGIYDDITERKQAEVALREANARLVLAQQSAGAGIWDWDMVTGTLYWSPEFFGLFGLDSATAPATFDTWLRVLHPDDRAAAAARLQLAIEQQTPLSSDYRIILPTGEMRWIHALGNTTCDMNGWEVCRRIKADPATAHIPVIIQTVRSALQDTTELESTKPDGFLNKPFDKSDLLAAMDQVMGTATAPGEV